MFTPHPKEPQMPAKPTARQLSYLKALASARGQSFTYPQTSAEASREINRLKGTRPDSHADRRRERHAIADAIQAGPADVAARVRSDEIDGYGSSATWVQNREQVPAPVEDPGPAKARYRPVVGERSELASYTVAGESRVIVGQRVDGVVRVSDVPAGEGRSYLIERELETKAELDALVADYLERAKLDDAVPMSTVGSVEIPS